MEMKSRINLRYLSADLSAGNSSYLCWKMLRMDADIILAVASPRHKCDQGRDGDSRISCISSVSLQPD